MNNREGQRKCVPSRCRGLVAELGLLRAVRRPEVLEQRDGDSRHDGDSRRDGWPWRLRL